MNAPTLSNASILLAAEWNRPHLVLRLDLEPLKAPGEEAQPVLVSALDAPELSPAELTAVQAATGKAVQAEWPSSQTSATLELYLNYASEPLVLRNVSVQCKRSPYSAADLLLKFHHIRSVAEHELGQWWREYEAHRELRARLKHLLLQGVERSSRKVEFFSASEPSKARAAEAQLGTFNELLAALEKG